MPKRKRGADGDPSATKQTYIQKELYERKTALFRAMKLAKGFERQKLARRLKDADTSTSAQDKERIDAEIEALRDLDLHAVAERYMYKTLLRIKTIANAPNLPKDVVVESGPPLPQAVVNVTARLCNTKFVKAAMNETIDALQHKLKPPPARQNSDQVAEPKKIVRTDSPLEQTSGGGEYDSEMERTSDVSWAGIGEDDESEHDQITREGLAMDLDSDDYAAFDTRIADLNSSAEEQQDESDLESDSSFPLRRSGDVTKPPIIDATLAREVKSKPAQPGEVKVRPKPSATSTAFLPSLTMGGYWSGSESEPEDLDADEVAPVRKNRRGQRARQAIWEKKFGSGAKHLASDKQTGRDKGWDMKRGAASKNDLPLWKKKKFGITNAKAPAGVEGSNAVPVRNARVFGQDLKQKEAKRREDAPLHPSWEAKKKLKDAAIPAFQGKKVVFD